MLVAAEAVVMVVVQVELQLTAVGPALILDLVDPLVHLTPVVVVVVVLVVKMVVQVVLV
jgi:hypothetical protein